MRNILIIFSILLFSTILLGQDFSDHKFVKITQSGGITIATDSLGNAWIYDHELGLFVETEEFDDSGEDIGSSRTETGYDGGEVILPPEIRCVDIYEGDIIKLFRDIVIGIDQRIEGTVFAVGDVTVHGLVIGNVGSTQKVIIKSTGEVRGDVIAKEIRRERGGSIQGKRTEFPFPNLSLSLPGSVAFPSMVTFFLTGFLAFLCIIVIALVPKPVAGIVSKMESNPVASFFWGLLGWFSIAPVILLLAITVIGIPIALIVLPLVLFGALVMAVISVSIYIGKKLSPIIGWQDKSTYVKGVLGAITIQLPLIIGSLFQISSFSGLSSLLLVIYIIILSVGTTMGFGSVISTRFGTRVHTGWEKAGPEPSPSAKNPPPPPPPQPEPPPPPSPSIPPPPVPPPPPAG